MIYRIEVATDIEWRGQSCGGTKMDTTLKTVTILRRKGERVFGVFLLVKLEKLY